MHDETGKMPRHVSIIMDGNGRWALSRGLERNLGHRQGVEAVRDATEFAVEKGISYLSLFVFRKRTGVVPSAKQTR